MTGNEGFEGNGGDGQDLWVGLELADAAAGAAVGPVPVDRIVAGGRRIRRRRRAVVGAVALTAVVVLGGGAFAGLGGRTAGGTTIGAAGGAPLSAPTPAATSGSTPSVSTAARDPLSPLRVVLAEGTANGKEWKVWAALWTLAPKEEAFRQAQAIAAERRAVDPEVPEPTEAYVRQYWQPHDDVVNLYFTVGGVRLPHDQVFTTRSATQAPPPGGEALTGTSLGHWGKDDTAAPADVAVVSVAPDVARVAVTWADGTTTEPPLVTVADSPIRWVAVPRKAGTRAETWRQFGRDGAELPNRELGFLK
ncbi:hypothetical protein ACFXDE_20775 [Kitasatospora sp. NPDC059408]|uniref:hypothetical protein n=1 Tax=Kitasatospora sp. NPDC059408 TaxID=3346823 RepID=UPI0036A5C109